MIATRNPATGELVREFQPQPRAEIERALELCARAFEQHRRTPLGERAAKMRKLADALEERREQLARVVTLEMGKLLRDAVAEIDKCARCCRFYADNGAEFVREQIVMSDARRSAVRYEPLGVVLAIMPWNFPFWQVFRFAAPTVMAGNVCLLKHAANVPQCALTLAELFHAAGFAEGIFQTVLVETETAAVIIRDRRVKAVTLTGSDRAGSAVAEQAGAVLKKCVLELGGSDPFIVRPSADLAEAVSMAIRARMVNSGQSCIAAKRILIANEIYDTFVGQFVEKMRALRMGDPLDENTELAPLATEAILRGVDEQVQRSVAAGATILTGGKRARGAGYYYEPTVLTDIPEASPAYHEEVFGPVALLFRVHDTAEAVRLANDSPFGLGASVWTKDAQEQDFFARELDAGMVFINAIVASDPRLPFGGVKRSGYGRELGAEGMREFTNMKTVYLAA